MLDDLLPAGLRPVRSTPDLIAEVLRQAISDGRLAAGRPLRQVELAAELGVSRIPLREALRRLEAEGLVRHSPHRGAVVAELSWQEAREIGEMRLALELLALRRAVPRLDPATLDRAEALLAEAERTTDPGRWSALNRQFHTALYAPSERPLLLAHIERLHHNLDRYMRLVLGDLGHQRVSQDEHAALLAACRAGDAETACAVLEHHIATADARLVAHLEAASGEGAPATATGRTDP